MVTYSKATTAHELQGINSLQEENLAKNLSLKDIKNQGFVSMTNSLSQLQKLNEYENHVIAKDHEKIIAYLLAMTQQSKFDIPILFPMFKVFEEILYNEQKVSDYNYLVVGQVCVDKNYREQGILDNCYASYKTYYSDKYDFAITEIASTNLRSINAHKRIGFKVIHTYLDPDDTEWVVVVWNWGKKS